MELREIGDWVFRERRPTDEGPHRLLLMIHGWTGDENSMGVFGERMPGRYWLLAPRGIYPSPTGGYSWFQDQEKTWPWVDDFRPALEGLFDFLTIENFPGVNLEKIDLMGFSQGTALVYALAFQYTQRLRSLAGLAGFMPEGCEALARNQPLIGKRVFVAHGTLDKLVPIEKGRESVKILEAAGGEVTYCEDEVEHKLSKKCFSGLRQFFR